VRARIDRTTKCVNGCTGHQQVAAAGQETVGVGPAITLSPELRRVDMGAVLFKTTTTAKFFNRIEHRQIVQRYVLGDLHVK
jgi:hypothetical protein